MTGRHSNHPRKESAQSKATAVRRRKESGQAKGTGSGSFGPVPVPFAVRSTRSVNYQRNPSPFAEQ